MVWFILGKGESRIELGLRVIRTSLPLFIIINTHLKVLLRRVTPFGESTRRSRTLASISTRTGACLG